jgi:hypothetical protein
MSTSDSRPEAVTSERVPFGVAVPGAHHDLDSRDAPAEDVVTDPLGGLRMGEELPPC